jgi:hypothetical protein
MALLATAFVVFMAAPAIARQEPKLVRLPKQASSPGYQLKFRRSSARRTTPFMLSPAVCNSTTPVRVFGSRRRSTKTLRSRRGPANPNDHRSVDLTATYSVHLVLCTSRRYLVKSQPAGTAHTESLSDGKRPVFALKPGASRNSRRRRREAGHHSRRRAMNLRSALRLQVAVGALACDTIGSLAKAVVNGP